MVVRLWDLRRLIVPLTLFIEKPFQNDRPAPCTRGELRADTPEARQDAAPGMREDTQRDGERRARTAAP